MKEALGFHIIFIRHINYIVHHLFLWCQFYLDILNHPLVTYARPHALSDMCCLLHRNYQKNEDTKSIFCIKLMCIMVCVCMCVFQNATIEYSSKSVCVCVCLHVCFSVSCGFPCGFFCMITQKVIDLGT